MSINPRNGVHHPGRNGNDQAHENFARFFEQWLQQQDRDLQALLSAVSAPPRAEDERRVRSIVDRVISNYEGYYRAKSASAKADVKPMFHPSWTSSTEQMFLWVGGWRPSLAFHLLYSKSGLQLESQLEQILSGVRTRDLSNMSPEQLEKIDQLQRKTVKMEREISEAEAEVQETAADTQMVELASVITEIEDGSRAHGEGEEMLGPQMERREEKIERVLERTDRLRIETLKGVVEIPRPLQAAHFLIAAAELHLRIHEFGRSKDARVLPG